MKIGNARVMIFLRMASVYLFFILIATFPIAILYVMRGPASTVLRQFKC